MKSNLKNLINKLVIDMSKRSIVELKLPAIPDIELAATKTSEIVAKHMKLSEEKSAEINMALIEACINAFEHSKSKKDIYIKFIVDEESLTIKVIDKGVGFDKSKVKIPNIEKKLKNKRKRGWGLKLINELMDSVEWESSEKGTTVTMKKMKKL